MTTGHGLVQFSNIKLPGELWATSRTSQAVPLQTEYNKIRSQMVEDRRLMGRPKWVAPEGCLQIQEIDNKPGQIIFYDPVAARGVPPRAERGVGTNPSNFQEVQLASEEINDVMSWHEASQGQLSSNVTSGRQAQVYQKADSGSYGPCIRDFERGLKRFGKIFVKCLKENMSNERIGSIIGKNHQHEIFKFSAADITDEATIRFEIASQLPWNRDAVQQTLFWMYTQQLIDKDTLLQYIRMPLESEVYETDQVHKLNAQKENVFLRETFFLPCETDKHQAHILEHMAEINKPDNRERIIQFAVQNNGQRPPDILNMLQHMEAHRKAIPPPQPAPADTKVHLTGQLPPQETIRISQGTVAADATAKPNQQQQPEESSGGVATPPGGGSGELYAQPGNEAMEGVGETGGGEGIQ